MFTHHDGKNHSRFNRMVYHLKTKSLLFDLKKIEVYILSASLKEY